MVVDQQGLPLSDTVIDPLLDVSKNTNESLPLTSIDQV
ncbi:MAG TPA: methylamine utilization protein, partial [Methylophaga sp.]|nr:methylamine utilization protein [Methylophaga sp.]